MSLMLWDSFEHRGWIITGERKIKERKEVDRRKACCKTKHK